MSNEHPPTILDTLDDLFVVTANDYFDKMAPRKFLHFFQNDDNKLHIIDLGQLLNLE